MKLKTNQNYSKTIIKKEKLEEEIKRSLRDYLEFANYPLEIVDEILDDNFIKSNPAYYLYYPYLFSQHFNVTDIKTLNLISISGFLYYKSIILIDNIFDNNHNSNRFQDYFIANICQEETIKILSSFFDRNSKFWNTWNLRRFEYGKAYKLDKSLRSINDYSEFEKLADYKSAFGKIAIDCLYHLSEIKDKLTYKSLLESHKFFYACFQIIDDIDDFIEDSQNGQFNISRQELINTLLEENDCIENYSIKNQKKLIYLKKVSEKLYIKAIDYLDKSLNIVTNLKNNSEHLWISEINNLHNICISHILNISGFIEVHKTTNSLNYHINNNASINKALELGNKFIKSKQHKEGNWNDIFNDAGISDVWTTSFVAYHLSEYFEASKEKKLIKNFILKSSLPNNLWGYNKYWIEDADSTSFAILCLQKYIKDEINLKNWLSFQNYDGGFTTYNNKEILLSSLNSPEIKDVDGWLQSHFCVSAVAYLVFCELRYNSSDNFSNLRKYLINKLKNNSQNQNLSYWWTEDIYSINYLLKGATLLNDIELISLCKVKIEEIIETKKPSNLFFTSQLLNSLCLTDYLFNKYEKKIKKLANKIIANQYTDGSWAEGFSLQIPHPSIKNTNNIVWKKENKGTNIIVKDYNRLFTTTSCLTSLISYEKRL